MKLARVKLHSSLVLYSYLNSFRQQVCFYILEHMRSLKYLFLSSMAEKSSVKEFIESQISLASKTRCPRGLWLEVNLKKKKKKDINCAAKETKKCIASFSIEVTNFRCNISGCEFQTTEAHQIFGKLENSCCSLQDSN